MNQISLRSLCAALLISSAAGGFAATPDLSTCDAWQPAASCNFQASSRPSSAAINYVIIHKVQGSAASAASWFQNCAAGVSAHFTFNNSTGYCYQSVREKDIAWHCINRNTYGIGIEHGGYVTSNDTATVCYDESAIETRSCIIYYTVLHDRSRIQGHSEVPGNSHTDPGQYWNWTYYMSKCSPSASYNNPSYYFDSGSQGWSTGSNGMTAAVWQAPGGWPGIIYGDQTGNDGFWTGPDTNYAGGGDPSVNVQVYPQSGASANHNMQLFWRTSEENFFSADKSSQIASYVAQNGWYSLNLSLNNPKYWGKTVTGWRLDFDNTNVGARFIVNHMLLQTTPRNFFQADTNGWSSLNALTPLVHQAGGSWGDIIYCDQVGNDPHMQGPDFSMLGGHNDRIVVRVYPQSGNSASHDMQVFWRTSAENSFSADKSTPVVSYSAQNAWTQVVLSPGIHGKWGGNWITGLRLDFDQTNKGNRWIVDHIMVDHN